MFKSMFVKTSVICIFIGLLVSLSGCSKENPVAPQLSDGKLSAASPKNTPVPTPTPWGGEPLNILKGYWQLDGNTLDQISGSYGTWIGIGGYGNGLSGASGYFDGQSFIQVSDFSLYDQATTLTISAWIYPVYQTSMGGIVSKAKYENNIYDFAIMLAQDGSLYVRSYLMWLCGNNEVLFNQWNHVAVVWNETEVQLYLNNVLIGSASGPGLTWTSWPVTIGSVGNALGFSGYIDEVRISVYPWDEYMVSAEYHRFR